MWCCSGQVLTLVVGCVLQEAYWFYGFAGICSQWVLQVHLYPRTACLLAGSPEFFAATTTTATTDYYYSCGCLPVGFGTVVGCGFCHNGAAPWLRALVVGWCWFRWCFAKWERVLPNPSITPAAGSARASTILPVREAYHMDTLSMVTSKQIST
jgi:hypothetical protein